ncbi:MAG: phospholipid carrier-dependent glycosyltransferase [Microcoleus sp. PH2017_40_RAT_O_B]|uniref:glycosyltransferase family 39 protein n=1 Tax=unclassified Microcoleus TaxID=2642155 RepID=UPI001D6B20DB|nr:MULTISPECIES: glycosyltransferase family 39 protein [unclassified Microcoleus]MCC3575531.1 phospholipid carrier-dependent glycosyltransferase [Microcoleus sp. PH2017_34_RAT_O_A]MCC3613198.1 phospholipid carrier-dependent glycosyltransferase [Microcoleus sp. PH2017_40_RAT_O_B]
MAQQHRDSRGKSMLILGIIWLLGAISDRLWFACDRSVPAWDQAEYLTSTLNYLQALQHPQWFSGDWWTSFWLLSTKIPPLVYILTVPFLHIFGTGGDRATLVHLLFSAILLASVYNLGTKLFNRQVGLWAAAICVLLPGLYRFRLQFLLDFPLTAAITFCFYCLTMWKKQENAAADFAVYITERKNQENRKIFYLNRLSFFWAIAFGISLGLSILVKHTTVLFLFTPILWLAVGAVRQKAWGRLAQLAGALLLSAAVFGPWAKTNWLLILTGGKRATFDSAIAEGDPGLNTIGAWIYYIQHLPEQVSWPLLLIPLVGFILYYWRNRADSQSILYLDSCRWLGVFWIGAYLINSLNINKDDRYVIPYLPILAIFLAYCLTLWPQRWGKQIRWGTIGLGILAMLFHIWPLGGGLGNNSVQVVSPGNSSYPYLGKQWPHQEVIAEIIDTEPYLQSTLGVLPSTPEINQHNLNYYGALANFQVYGRQVGTNLKEVPQDVRSLSWFVTKTGPQGSIRERIKKAQNAAVAAIETGGKFNLQKSWVLPDNTNLNLYRKQLHPVEIQPLPEARSQVQLEQVTVLAKPVPGIALPVTYTWSGPWQQLQSGLVLLTWQNQQSGDVAPGQTVRILHDRAIGQATLHPGMLEADKFAVGFRVVDRTAMLTPANIAPGSYNLQATYLNRKTGETYPINVPQVTLKIDAQPEVIASQTRTDNENDKKLKIAEQVPANEDTPELDLVTQLRAMAVNLPKGLPGLEPVFEQIGRINQYDPTQDYTVQAEQALAYRLKQEPNNLEFAYALAFSRVLQQNVESAIGALEKVTQLDSQNPYAYAYLAFVQIYGWHPKAAETALKPALALNPNLPEIRILNGLAALMQGNVIQAWQDLQFLKKLKI